MVISIPSSDIINVNDITSNHLVVAVINNNPCILTKEYDSDYNKLGFNILNDKFINGNSYLGGDNNQDNDIPSVVAVAIKLGWSVAVFEEDEWKNALRWLIDNVKNKPACTE